MSHITRNTTSAIRSHQSYEGDVVGICHHSGRYLTRNEINPGKVPFLQARHEFPGLPKLDKLLTDTVHSAEHEHYSWSKPTVRGLAAFTSGGILLALAYSLAPANIFINGGWLLDLFTAFLAGLNTIGVVSILYGLYQILNRDRLYHEQAIQDGTPPAILDYPIQATYKIKAYEQIGLHLTNIASGNRIFDKQQCLLAVTIVPSKKSEVESYTEYRSRYSLHVVGEYVHAGMLALDKLRGVRFVDPQIEFRHRFPLRQRVSQTPIGTGKDETFTLQASYEITPETVSPKQAGLERFLLRFEPRMMPSNSRGLELCFKWLDEGTSAIWLEACQLTVPMKLKRTVHAPYGRIQREDSKPEVVIWRNRLFQDRELVLQVIFDEPLLKYATPPVISAEFTIQLEDYLISGMTIQPTNLFSAWGKRIDPSDCIIRKESRVHGTLQIDLQRLSQEHEYVRTVPPITRQIPPDEQIVDKVAAIMLGLGFDIQHINQAEPTLDLEGELDQRLLYWDIVGRAYHHNYLDPVDLHGVITGCESASGPWADQSGGNTRIDLTLRCVHDPRNKTLTEWTDSLIDQQDAHGLVARIERALDNVEDEQPQSANA